MSDKSALITGITGQDGAYLSKLLLGKGYDVFGLYRRTSSPNFWRLQVLGVSDKVHLIPGDVTDVSSLIRAIRKAQPDEVYNLAAQSFVGASFETPIATSEIDALAPIRILEILKAVSPHTRFYQASTSEVFGDSHLEGEAFDIGSPKTPSSPYAAAKLHAQHSTRIYREAYDMFAVSGILFNHESPLRGLEFITRKISNAVARIKLGLADSLVLGNLDSRRDWGYAPEYVEAMWAMLQQDDPEDFVIATGESHSVREFLEAAFGLAGLNESDYVSTDSAFLRPLDVTYLRGDASRAQRQLGWQSKTSFDELVRIMVDADLDRWQRHVAGEIFAWDAPNHIEII